MTPQPHNPAEPQENDTPVDMPMEPLDTPDISTESLIVDAEAGSAPAKEAAKEPEPHVDVVNTKVTQDFPVFGQPLGSAGNYVPIYLFRVDSRGLAENFDRLPLSSLREKELKDIVDPWERALKSADPTVVSDGAYIDSFEREGTSWVQIPKVGTSMLGASRVGSKNKDTGKELVADAAIAKFQTMTGLGSLVKIPLWHTGLWVTFKAPSDMRLNVMIELVNMEKMRLGRESAGLALSNTSIWLHDTILDLVKECLYHVNLKDFDAETFVNLLSVHDLNTCYWGLACAIWPNGYPLSQPCTADSQCRHITNEHLNLSKISFTNMNGLTQKQLTHMADSKTMRTVDEILAYQAEFAFSKNNEITLDMKQFGRESQLKMELIVPSAATYIRSGNTWVNECIQSIQRAFSDRVSEQKRDQFIKDQSDITTIRQYAHFVKTIIYDDGSFVKNVNDIGTILNMLSASPEATAAFLGYVRKFIDDTVVSVIAIPSYRCPGCAKPMTPVESKNPHLIPLDALSVFFTLAARKL